MKKRQSISKLGLMFFSGIGELQKSSSVIVRHELFRSSGVVRHELFSSISKIFGSILLTWGIVVPCSWLMLLAGDFLIDRKDADWVDSLQITKCLASRFINHWLL